MKYKDFIISMSFVNLIFYNYWSVIIYFSPSNSYYFKYFPSAKTFLAFIISELIAGFIVWLGIKLVRYLNNKFILKTSKIIFTLVALSTFYEMIWDYAKKLKIYGGNYHYIPTTIFLLYVIFLLIRRKLIKTTAKAVLLIAPFVLMVFGQAIWMMTVDLKMDDNSRNVASVATVEQSLGKRDKTSPRVLWILFDEMDQRFSFDDRPKNVKLPEFDRFKEEAFYAPNVHQTADQTGKAIPSLFTGKIVTDVRTINSSELMIKYKGTTEAVRWSEEPDIFSEVKKMGFKTALTGDGHPYSRILGHKIDYCRWYDDELIPSPTASLWYNIYNQLSFLTPFDEARRGRKIHSQIIRDAQELVANPDYQLIFIHFLIPHAPRINEKWGLINLTQWGYFGNLELADQTFGSLRRIMEENGLWENTTVLITSDHQWRKSNRIDGKKDPRVPFILKLAGEKKGVIYEPSFNAVLTKDILLAVLRNQIVTNEDLVIWLNEHLKQASK